MYINVCVCPNPQNPSSSTIWLCIFFWKKFLWFLQNTLYHRKRIQHPGKVFHIRKTTVFICNRALFSRYEPHFRKRHPHMQTNVLQQDTHLTCLFFSVAVLLDDIASCVVVCCSMLQRVAVCCSVLRRVAVHCNVLKCVCQCAAVCRSALQCAAVCCSVLQCAAVCCRVLQGVAGCCRVLQGVEVCCSVFRLNICHPFWFSRTKPREEDLTRGNTLTQITLIRRARIHIHTRTSTKLLGEGLKRSVWSRFLSGNTHA